jgi:hypothetical protein
MSLDVKTFTDHWRGSCEPLNISQVFRLPKRTVLKTKLGVPSESTSKIPDPLVVLMHPWITLPVGLGNPTPRRWSKPLSVLQNKINGGVTGLLKERPFQLAFGLLAP